MDEDAQAIGTVRGWIEQVVVGLNLCPFAGVPFQQGRIRITVSRAETEQDLLDDLAGELERLDQTSPVEMETTLIVLTRMLRDFEEYNQFLDEADALLQRRNWEGVFQIASFHPHYQFAGTQPEDRENLTNRAPWPILHILREASVEAALESFPNPEQIPERNIKRVETLSEAEVKEKFPWIAPRER